MKHIHPLALSLCLLTTACTTTDPPAPAHLMPPMASTDAPDPADDTAQAIASGEVQTGAAVGLLTSPITTRILRWLGQVVLQAVTNTTLQIQMSTPAPPPVHTPHKPPDSR